MFFGEPNESEKQKDFVTYGSWNVGETHKIFATWTTKNEIYIAWHLKNAYNFNLLEVKLLEIHAMRYKTNAYLCPVITFLGDFFKVRFIKPLMLIWVKTGFSSTEMKFT